MTAPTAGQHQGAGGGGYRMVSTDGGREMFWARSDYTRVLFKTTQMESRSWRGVDKVCHV